MFVSKKLIVLAVCITAASAAFAVQQSYPNVEKISIVFENAKVVVQKLTFEPGDWVGEHAHDGGQMVVVLKGMTTVYKEGGKEKEVVYKSGDVFWIDAVTHDHKAMAAGEALLVNFK